MANELLPCPFCSGPAEIYNPFHMIGKPSQPATYRGGVRCRACGCESKATTPPDGAITTWNRRANAAPQASAENVRNAALEEAAKLMDQTLRSNGAALIRGLKRSQAHKDGGQQRAGDDFDVEAAAKTMAECMDYPWAHMPEKGREQMRLHAQSVIRSALSATQAEQGERDAD
ncbi:Lar family restriction alleviation protein [Achromobacter xylosoxidans]